MKRLAVYCGSRSGVSSDYSRLCIDLAQRMTKQNLGLVYGGGNVGLMGIIADEVLKNDGQVIGVIPQALKELEVAHSGLTELHVVDNMHTRKSMMIAMADAFIALPGGIGTLEELFEVFSWDYLKIHTKPIAIYNCNGFYDSLLVFMKNCVDQGFLNGKQMDRLIVINTKEELNNFIHMITN